MKHLMLTLLLVTACADNAVQSNQDANQAASVDVTDSLSAQKDLWDTPCPTDNVMFRTVNVGDISLNVACRGEGPTIVLLHGFPEFWMGWNEVMARLATNYRLIVPDQRGVNLSDKPAEVDAYALPILVKDIVGLIDAISDEPVTVVGHDWGGAVAWALAAMHPDKVEQLVILNAPHPDVFARELKENPAQQEASFYVDIVISEEAEAILSASDYAFLTGAMGGVLSENELASYKKAWSQPGALTGMVNWYRANFKDGLPKTGTPVTISVPTLVLWGLADTALLPGNIEGLDAYVETLEIQTFEGVSHWIAHEIPDKVSSAIDAFVSDSRSKE